MRHTATGPGGSLKGPGDDVISFVMDFPSVVSFIVTGRKEEQPLYWFIYVLMLLLCIC